MGHVEKLLHGNQPQLHQANRESAKQAAADAEKTELQKAQDGHADFTCFVGNASQAYDAPMKTFKRAVLLIRPNVYIVYDELAATEKSTFSWLLNTFAKPDIDAVPQKMVVAQRDERLQVQQLFPQGLQHSTTNKRPYPMITKAWTHYTAAFLQPWHTEVTNLSVTDEGI